MKRLNDFEVERRQLTADELLAEIEAEEAESGDGNGLVGETCFHVDFPDFRCKVLYVDDERAYVKVLDGWRGPLRPMKAIPVPTAKLGVLS